MYANLLKYSSSSSTHRRRHSTRHSIKAAQPSLSPFRAFWTMARRVWMMATSSEPKQMEPKDVVVARTKESRMPGEQQELASAGENHQVETTPAMVTWMVFCGGGGSTGAEDVRKH